MTGVFPNAHQVTRKLEYIAKSTGEGHMLNNGGFQPVQPVVVSRSAVSHYLVSLVL
jgi:hypothetical protein